MIGEQLQRYKETLLRIKKELEDGISHNPVVEDMGNDVETDFSTEADEAEEMVNNAAVRFELEKRLKSVEKALEKIDTGVYGSCDKCHNSIHETVLKAEPDSKLCKDCKHV